MPDNKSRMAKIPQDIYKACEKEARKRRKRSGKLIYWTQILFEKARKANP